MARPNKLREGNRRLIDGQMLTNREHAERLGMTYQAYRSMLSRTAKRMREGKPELPRKYNRIDPI